MGALVRKSSIRKRLDGGCAFLRKLRFFAIGGIFMDYAFAGRGIDRADGRQICCIGSGCVVRLQSVLKPTDGSPNLGLDHTVIEILLFGDANPLNSRFDIRQNIHPL